MPWSFIHLVFHSILPIPKDSLGWMINKLKINFNLLLDESELSAIHLDNFNNKQAL